MIFVEGRLVPLAAPSTRSLVEPGDSCSRRWRHLQLLLKCGADFIVLEVIEARQKYSLQPEFGIRCPGGTPATRTEMATISKCFFVITSVLL